MPKRENRPYLTHDLGARNDPKLMNLTMEMGGQGKAIWWDLVEMLWEQDGYLPTNYRAIAYNLRYCTEEEVRRVAEDFGLFEKDGDRFWNASALARMSHKREVSATKAAAVNARWNKACNTRGEEPVLHKDEGKDGCVIHTYEGKDTNVVHTNNGAGTDKKQRRYSPNTDVIQYNIINKYNQEYISISAYTSAREEGGIEIERFFMVFHFEKSLRDPVKELARFITHYEPSGWSVGGQPVKDRVALARRWAPPESAARSEHDAAAFGYLGRAYRKAFDGSEPERWRLVREVYAMESKRHGAACDITYTLTRAAADVLERTNLREADTKIFYRITPGPEEP